MINKNNCLIMNNNNTVVIAVTTNVERLERVILPTQLINVIHQRSPNGGTLRNLNRPADKKKL